jgi:imidazolonepropionase-like amidohydrolase
MERRYCSNLEEKVMPRLSTVTFAILLGAAGLAQVPTAELARPPANARHFTIVSAAGPHGESWMWTANETRMSRESLNLRGQVFETDGSATPGADGMPARVIVRGVTPQGDAAETFTIENGRANWKSPVDTGSAAYTAPRFYSTFGGPIDMTAWLIERLVAAPNHTLDLLPGGQARADKLTTLDVGDGTARQTITAWAVSGLSNAPTPIWTDASGRFFGFHVGLAWLPKGFESALSAMENAQNQALAAQAASLGKQLARTPTGAVAFTNVQMYDATARRFLPDQTVVVSKDRIVAVGPSSATSVPNGAERIDGRGKTLVPGLWDCHMHVGGDFTGLQELSLGVTSIRDPGNSDPATMDRAKRRAAGDLLFPHVYASSLIDGKGPYTAQVANVATSEAEAVELVRRAKANGFIGVKFYGTLDPKWLPAAIAEAKTQGLHVHGHIPAGIRPLDAINAGYDEITHINWIVMQAMPDEVIKVSNGIARFEGPGRYGRLTDVDAPPLRELVQAMAAKKITSDPTMVAFEGLYVPEMGDLSLAYAPFVGTLPPTTERGFRQGGFAVPKDLTRADYKASFAMMKTVLAAMHRAKVPIVAGTDGIGIELVRELEIYVEAGLAPADALAAATIEPARLVNAQDRFGSIAVGKVADVVLVEGDPSKRIGDLRNTRVVMMDGKLMDADALRKAAGFSGRPKM